MCKPPQWDTMVHPLEYLKLKRLKIPSVGIYCWWDYKMILSCQKTIGFLKLNIHQSDDPAMPMQGIPKGSENSYAPYKTSTWMFRATLFTITKHGKQPKHAPPVEEYMM